MKDDAAASKAMPLRTAKRRLREPPERLDVHLRYPHARREDVGINWRMRWRSQKMPHERPAV